jgi:hypothetical protein
MSANEPREPDPDTLADIKELEFEIIKLATKYGYSVALTAIAAALAQVMSLGCSSKEHLNTGFDQVFEKIRSVAEHDLERRMLPQPKGES